MTAVAATPAHRQRLLRALGVTPWVRRDATPARTAPAQGEAMAAVDCVVVLPAGCAPAELDLLGRALHAYGAGLARAARIEVAGAAPPAPPVARHYLAFGEAAAAALRQVLAGDASVITVATPQELHRHGAAKRQLWVAMRGLRRQLAVWG